VKKISTKIIVIVLICSMAMSIMVGITSVSRSKNVIEKEARNNLYVLGKSYAMEFNKDLAVYESIVLGIEKLALLEIS